MRHGKDYQLMVFGPAMDEGFRGDLLEAAHRMEWGHTALFDRVDGAYTHLNNSVDGLLVHPDSITRDSQTYVEWLLSKARELGVPTGFVAREVVTFDGHETSLPVVRPTAESQPAARDEALTITDWLIRYGQRPRLKRAA